VSGRVRWLGYVESGCFIGIIWGVLDVEDDCRCMLSGKLCLRSLNGIIRTHTLFVLVLVVLVSTIVQLY
jgi:hypothetical protein